MFSRFRFTGYLETAACCFFFLYLLCGLSQAGEVFKQDFCEFSVMFPDKITFRKVVNKNIESVMAENKDVPHLRAECLQVDRNYLMKNFHAVLSNMATMAGFPNAQTSVEKTDIADVGSYTAAKIVAGHNMKLFGKCYLGKNTVLHVLVIEDLESFPSTKTIHFLDSVKRHR